MVLKGELFIAQFNNAITCILLRYYNQESSQNEN
jgi:hypothetical protein